MSKTVQLKDAVPGDPEKKRKPEAAWAEIIRGCLNATPNQGMLDIAEQRRRFKVLDKLDEADLTGADEFELEDAEFDTLYRAVFGVTLEPLSRAFVAIGDHLDEVKIKQRG